MMFVSCIAAIARKTLEDTLQCCDLLAHICYRNYGLTFGNSTLWAMISHLGRKQRIISEVFLLLVSRSLSAVLASVDSLVQNSWLFSFQFCLHLA